MHDIGDDRHDPMMDIARIADRLIALYGADAAAVARRQAEAASDAAREAWASILRHIEVQQRIQG